MNDVRIVGIWGMGGVGKTTIARAIFDILSNQFEVACFLADIKENKCGIHSLQNVLLSELLRKTDNYVNNKVAGKRLMACRLRLKKVLVVLDDIDHRDHFDYLAGDHAWFGNGSRIIATTRDKHLMGKNDVVYEVTPLVYHEAIRLFNQYAFKKEIPNACFAKLTREIVSLAEGLPLALKVWGSFLHNKRDIAGWSRTVDRIKKNSSSEIVDKLKISYDGLEPEEKEIFLDIACLFRGHPKKEAMQILESCGFGAESGLDVLIEKSLVFISKVGGIEMHDLIQDMGKYIVKMQKDPGERSRLWLVEDFEEVMSNNTGTKAVEAIWIHHCQKLRFNKKAMKNLRRLRILCVHNFDWLFKGKSKDYVMDGPIEYLANTLRWFVWHYYPSKSLPSNFEPKRLVHLELTASELHHLWAETKELCCLRTINLSYSKSLMRTPDFTGIPNLEYLNLSYCESLEEVHDSLGNCNKLIRLDLKHCKSLKRFPRVNVESLVYLCLRCCSSLEKFPKILGRMRLDLLINMCFSGIRELSSYLEYQKKLGFSGLEKLVALPSSISRLKSLVSLDVSGCSQLESLPAEIGDLENLEKLNAESTLISRPPSSIVYLNKLKVLSFARSGADAVQFVFPSVNEGLRSLQILDLRYCNLMDGGLPEDIGCYTLEDLRLSGNNLAFDSIKFEEV